MNTEKDWHILEFSAPITENAFVNDEFIIRGTAITETITHNNHKYIAEELEKAAPGLIGKPLLVDHDNRVEAIKGRVTDSHFDYKTKSIKFEAKVMDKIIREMIRDGRISSVSIGSFAEDLIKDEKSDSFIAKGLQIVELSLVAVPADNNASFTHAFDISYNLKEKLSIQEKPNTQLDERRLGEMEELNQIPDTRNKLAEELEIKNKNLLKEIEVLREEKRNALIKEYKKMCSEKKVKEKDLSKTSEETINLLIEQLSEIIVEKEEKKELKSVVTNSISEEFNNFVMEKSQTGKGYSMWLMPETKGNFILKKW